MDEKIIYRLNDNISFRECNLKDSHKLNYGDCTSFYEQQENFKTYYCCSQNGIHLHCTKHTAIELVLVTKDYEKGLKCKKCNNFILIENYDAIIKECLRLLNVEKFKDAKLVKLDDWYVPEIKERVDIKSDYWMKVEVKTDRDGDTIVVIYIGNKNSKEKSQIFIKPEKMQLNNDHKDLDPATILSKIELTLKDRKIIEEFEETK